MTKLFNKSLMAAFSFLFLMAISPITSAGENPFGMSNVAADQVQMSGKDGKCGEGKCGDSKKKSKCGEGKCGDSMKKGKSADNKKKGKCGEGKCGGSKKSGKCGDSEKEDKEDNSDD